MVSNTRTLRPSVVNELRFGYNQFRNDNLGDFAFQRNVTGELGIIGLEDPGEAAWGTPRIRMGDGLAPFGETEETPFVNRNHVFQLLNTTSAVRGKHTLRFGGEVRRDRYNHLGNSFQRGSFTLDARATFDPANRGTTGHSFADFLLGEARLAERALGTANALFRAASFSLFFEDSWKIAPRLTLNLGLRYENVPPWHDKYRGFLNLQFFDPGIGPDGLLTGTRVPILTRPGNGDFHEGISFHFHDPIPKQAGDQFLGRAMVRSDHNDLAPRIGIAYSPTARWTFRTGFGVFYAQDMGNPKFDMARNLAGRLSFPHNEERPNINFLDPWRFERAQAVCSNWSGPCLGAVQIQSASAGRRTPYIMQWIFNVQRQLSGNVVVEAGYQGSAGHKLERFRLYNQAVLRTGPGDTRSVQQRRPWSQFQNIFHIDGMANANYHGLGTKIQQRFSKGLTYLVSFTWSKSIDDASGIRQGGTDRLVPLDSYAIYNERGLSQFHQSRRFVASVLYELPFGKGNALIGGWEIGAILTFATGAPVDVGSIGDRASTSWLNQPDATGTSPFPDKPTADRFWNLAAFDTSNPQLSYRFGNVGRNVLRDPGLRQWDFSIIKNSRIREGHNLQFRFEAFNLPNHSNWNTPDRNPLNAAGFGRVASARAMRELQFGLRYVF